MEAEKVILQFSCPDKPGVLAAVTQFLFKNDAFMTEVSSFSAHDTKRFFNRIAFQKSDSSSFNLDTLELSLKEVKSWIKNGAQIIGGCCGIGVEEIKAISILKN